MSFPVIDLDTTNFESLVEQSRAMIPRYAPQWTDHNLHDPGMTLIDLLAWIVDQQVYRLGFVGDGHLSAFARLLGVTMRATQPARGLIWPSDDPVMLPARLAQGTEITSIRQPEIDFLLEHSLYLSDARPVDAQFNSKDESFSFFSLSGKPNASIELAIAETKSPANLSFTFDQPIIPVGAPAGAGHVCLGIEALTLPSVADERSHGWGPLVFDYRVAGSDWLPVEVVKDTTLALAATGYVILDIPSPAAAGGCELRLRLDRGFFPVAPRIRRVSLNVLPIMQARTTAAATLGRSTGQPHQEFEFDAVGIVQADGRPGPEIFVEEPAGLMPWQAVPDFRNSGPDDRHFVIQAGRLIFGNGVNGKIPQRDTQVRHGTFMRSLGAAGNLRSGLAWRVAGLAQGPDGFGTNPAPISKGADAWSLDELVAAARSAAMHRSVALTDAELKSAALQLPGAGIARVEVLAGFDAVLPDRESPAVRTLIVIPHRSAGRAPAPVPDQYLSVIKALLDDRRVLGERLQVTAPKLKPVDVSVRLIAAQGTDRDDLVKAAHSVLQARLSDLQVDGKIEPWQFGRTVTCGEVKTLLANLEGVSAVTSCAIAVSGTARGTESITLARDELAIASSIDILVQPEGAGPA